MATLRDYISSIKSMFRMTSSDVNLSDRAIASEIRYTKNELIKRETDLRRLFNSPNLFSEISCVEMERVPLSECCDYRSDCYIAKSLKKLPKIAENKRGLLIQGVFSINKREKFSDTNNPTRYANYLQMYPKGNKRFYWVSTEGYLYITDPSIETVTIIAHFTEDINVQDFACCADAEDCPINPLDKEFKIPDYLEERMIKMVYDKMNNSYKRSKEDLQEDDVDQTI